MVKSKNKHLYAVCFFNHTLWEAKKGLFNENSMATLVKEVHAFADLIQRKKAQNPLISDELVATASEAATDSDNALSLTKKAIELDGDKKSKTGCLGLLFYFWR